MSRMKDISDATVQIILDDLRRQAAEATTLQDSAQRFMESFRASVADSVILARTYATVPFGILPARDRAFVEQVARSKDQVRLLTDETQTLSLLGTSGIEPAWCDRYRSKDHLGIPLLSQEFVSGIPMVAGLIRQLGAAKAWFAGLHQPQHNNNFGVFAESFFIRDAGGSRDSEGRLLIPAREFVRDYQIGTVLGVGGQFASTGMILVCIFFTRETLDFTPRWLVRVPLLLGTATLALVSSGKVYASSASDQPSPQGA